MPKALKSVETLAKLLMLVTKLKQTTGLKTRNWACLSKILSLKLNLGSNLRRLVSARAKKCRARSNSKPEYGTQQRSLPSSRSPAPALSAEPGAVVAPPHLARSRLARMDVFTSSLSLLASSHVRSTSWTLGGKLLHQTTSKNSQKINFAL